MQLVGRQRKLQLIPQRSELAPGRRPRTAGKAALGACVIAVMLLTRFRKAVYHSVSGQTVSASWLKTI